MARRMAMVVAAAVSIWGAGAARAQCAGTGAHGGHGEPAGVEEHHGAAYRSPGMAAALSLTPLPVDFGNLYTESIGWGIAYTTLELGLMTPMFFIAADHGMGHSTVSNPWTSADRNWMIGLVSGYLAVKLASGLHAARNAEAFNREHHGRLSAAIAPSPGGAMALAALRF